ncbi:MAG: PEP-CTERM sorting domain-containing protein [Lentisphaeria bacterium]|nr:PEP-CTERM sorting domain-containing protein [Lentisphaeria bacterium]
MKTRLFAATLSLSVGFCLISTVNAAILAKWDTYNDSNATGGYQADATLSGFTATITGPAFTTSGSYYSNDGTFGGTVGGASTANTRGIRVSAGFPTATFTLTNSTGTDYTINSLHFDYEVREAGTGFTLVYTSGGLGPASTTIATVPTVPFIGYNDGAFDYTDYDYTLASFLTDIRLADGESAVFTFTTTGGSNSSKFIDNIAFQGTSIPEPTTAILAGLGLMGVCFRRRRRY